MRQAGLYSAVGQPVHWDKHLEGGETPKLLDDDAFYSVMRRRVAAHLKDVGHPSGGPTNQCIALFWANFVAWVGMVRNRHCLPVIQLGSSFSHATGHGS